MTRIAGAFRRAREGRRAALIAYLMGGDPDLPTTEALALACEVGGADILELGIPFSDPIADGPEIQEAGERALRSRTRPRDVLALAGSLRRKSEVPLVLMSYVNPILAIGVDSFARRAAEAGVDGIIIPDVSLEVSDEIREAFDASGVDHIQLVAPSTATDRAAAIARASRGFLYVVARYGTTGSRTGLPEDLPSRISTLHRITDLPLAVGFGVSSGDQVRSLALAGADGIIIGSGIVRLAAETRDPNRVREYVATLASALPLEAKASSTIRGRNR